MKQGDDNRREEDEEPLEWARDHRSYWNQPEMAFKLVEKSACVVLGPYKHKNKNDDFITLREPNSGNLYQIKVPRKDGKPDQDWVLRLRDVYRRTWGERSDNRDPLDVNPDNPVENQVEKAEAGASQAMRDSRYISKQLYNNEALPFMSKDSYKPALKNRIDKFTWFDYLITEIGTATFFTLLQAENHDPATTDWSKLLDKFNTTDEAKRWFQERLGELLKFSKKAVELQKLVEEKNKWRMMYAIETQLHKTTRDKLTYVNNQLSIALASMDDDERASYTQSLMIHRFGGLDENQNVPQEFQNFQHSQRDQSVVELETPAQNVQAGLARFKTPEDISQ